MSVPQLVYASRDEPPFPVDAIVEEEDTYLSMSAGTDFSVNDEHPIRVMTEARTVQEIPPGTIMVRPGRPIKLLAVVHRLSDDPTWREAWVADAIDNLRAEIERRRIHAIGTPLLGTVHGKMSARRSFELMRPLLMRGRVWVFS